MFTNQELNRYNRHIILPEFGSENQLKLKNSKALVIGAGGLGSPVLQYLAAAGVGKIGIVDDDVVDESNLQRQVVFSVDDIGEPKCEAAKTRLLAQNPHIKIETYHCFLTLDNAKEIIEKYDLVVDGTDNFPTRYLVNDACVICNKPLVFGSIFKFEGQVSVFNYKSGPTYRCLYPEPPGPDEVPSCSDVGVLGILPAVVGSLMAAEVIKILTGIGEVLSGKLLMYDALNTEFKSLSFSKSNEIVTELAEDYQSFCGILELPESIDVDELKKWIDSGEEFQLLDVREPFERETCKLENDIHIPMNSIPNFANKLNKEIPLVVYCHHGMRSQSVINFLSKEIGFDKLINLSGGIHAWAVKMEDGTAIY